MALIFTKLILSRNEAERRKISSVGMTSNNEGVLASYFQQKHYFPWKKESLVDQGLLDKDREAQILIQSQDFPYHFP